VPGVVLGWDMAAALAIAGALGIPARAVAELLLVIEASMVRHLNARMDGSTEGLSP
jgi:hypothetical protein